MRGKILIRLTAYLAMFLLLDLAPSGCVYPLNPNDISGPEIWFGINVPGSGIATKAEPGTVSGSNAETTLYDIQAWAFLHGTADSDQVVGYCEATDINVVRPAEGNYPQLRMRLPYYFLDKPDSELKIDIYVLANWHSIFTTKPYAETRGELEALVFGTGAPLGDTGRFGTTPTTSVADAGLPISAIYKGDNGNGMDISYIKDNPTEASLLQHLKVIPLQRAVSKIRFVFSRPTDVTDVEITRVEVDENIIPEQTYAFPPVGGSIVLPTTDYASTVTALSGNGGSSLLSGAEIGEYPDPRRFTSTWYFDNQEELAQLTSRYSNTPQGYNYWLDDAVNHYDNNNQLKPQATERLLYLRESDKPVTGKVYYRINGGTEKSKVFTMQPAYDEDPDLNNFSRNHIWVVYSYFNDKLDDLTLTVDVLPWYWREKRIDYSTGTVNVLRRFNVPSDPNNYDKVLIEDTPAGSKYEIRFDSEKVITGDIIIDAPVGGELYVTASGANAYFSVTVYAAETFDPMQVTPGTNHATINPAVNNGTISVRVEISPTAPTDGRAGQKIDLSFYVVIHDGTPQAREINIDSESIDHYSFKLTG